MINKFQKFGVTRPVSAEGHSEFVVHARCTLPLERHEPVPTFRPRFLTSVFVVAVGALFVLIFSAFYNSCGTKVVAVVAVAAIGTALIYTYLRGQHGANLRRGLTMVLSILCCIANMNVEAADGVADWRIDKARAQWTIEAHGFYAVTALVRDTQGVWRGRAWQYGRLSIVEVDDQGNFDVVTPVSVPTTATPAR